MIWVLTKCQFCSPRDWEEHKRPRPIPVLKELGYSSYSRIFFSCANLGNGCLEWFDRDSGVLVRTQWERWGG